MRRELLNELNELLEKWIENTNTELCKEGSEQSESYGSLSTLLLLKNWVDDKLNEAITVKLYNIEWNDGSIDSPSCEYHGWDLDEPIDYDDIVYEYENEVNLKLGRTDLEIVRCDFDTIKSKF